MSATLELELEPVMTLPQAGFDVNGYRMALRWVQDMPTGVAGWLRYLADYADWDTGRKVFPGLARTIVELGAKETALRGYRRWALEHGWIRQVRSGTSAGDAAEYELTLPGDLARNWKDYREAAEQRVTAQRAQPVDKPSRCTRPRDARGRLAPRNPRAGTTESVVPPSTDLPSKAEKRLSVPTVPPQGAGEAVEETRSDPSSLSHCGVRPDSGGGDRDGVERRPVGEARRRRPTRGSLPARRLRRRPVRRGPDRGPGPGVPRRPVPGVRARDVRPGRPGPGPCGGSVPPEDRPPEGEAT